MKRRSERQENRAERHETVGSCTFSVRAKPRASKDRILGLKEGLLEVSVTAPPVDGKANRAICAVLAAALSVGVSSVRVVSGDSARIKRVEVSGLGWDDVARRLGLL